MCAPLTRRFDFVFEAHLVELLHHAEEIDFHLPHTSSEFLGCFAHLCNEGVASGEGLGAILSGGAMGMAKKGEVSGEVIARAALDGDCCCGNVQVSHEGGDSIRTQRSRGCGSEMDASLSSSIVGKFRVRGWLVPCRRGISPTLPAYSCVQMGIVPSI